jgi:hypothetical protein
MLASLRVRAQRRADKLMMKMQADIPKHRLSHQQ